MMQKVLLLLKPYKWHFAAGVLLSAATVVAGIGLMSSSGYLISRAAQRPMIVDLFMVTAAVRFFGISRAVVRYTERLVSHDLTFKVLFKMRGLLYRKLDSLSLTWMLGKRPGDLLSTVVADVESLQHVYLRIVSPGMVAACISTATCLMLWFFDPRLALVVFLSLAMAGLFIPWLAMYLGKGRGKADVDTKAKLKVFLVDQLQGMQDVLWMGQEAHSKKTFSDMQKSIATIQHQNAGVSGLVEGLTSFAANTGALMVLILAVPLVLAGDIKGVMLAMLTLGVLSSFEAVQGLGHAFLSHEASKESAERLFAIMESKHDAPDGARQPVSPAQQKPLPRYGDLVFQDVSFSYHDDGVAVGGISFRVPFGSKTAIVGPTGSGKTTLINILLRFWEIDRGLILMGDTDIRQLDADRLRSMFAVVSQDEHIFNRSLRENLLVADSAADDNRLNHTLHAVGLGEFARNLDMQLGNHGMRLSGGQRQLLFLARSLLKNASFWMFDEATAHLDVQTERHVLNTVWSIRGNRTCIMITHRLVDMDKMDQIVVMEKGRVIACGPHAELLAGNRPYRRMFEQYIRVIRD